MSHQNTMKKNNVQNTRIFLLHVHESIGQTYRIAQNSCSDIIHIMLRQTDTIVFTLDVIVFIFDGTTLD
jgi:hypothetical protein